MKMDKETLIKNRFWVVLVSFLPIFLIIWLVLTFGVSGTVSAARDEVKKTKDAVSGIRDPKNEKFVAALEGKAKKLDGQKGVVWQQAWESQDGMMTWPYSARTPTLRNHRNFYFGDDIPDLERREFADTLYRTQFDQFKNMVFPAEYNGGWQNIIRFVGKAGTTGGEGGGFGAVGGPRGGGPRGGGAPPGLLPGASPRGGGFGAPAAGIGGLGGFGGSNTGVEEVGKWPAPARLPPRSAGSPRKTSGFSARCS